MKLVREKVPTLNGVSGFVIGPIVNVKLLPSGTEIRSRPKYNLSDLALGYTALFISYTVLPIVTECTVKSLGTVTVEGY